MEHIKKPARPVLGWIFLFLTLFISVSCDSAKDGTPATGDIVQTGEQGSPPDTGTGGNSGTVTPDEGGEPETPVADGYYIEQVKSIAGSSSCATYSWAGRGKAPAAYIKGMALTFARSFCRLKTSEASPTALATLLSRAAGSATTDALGQYSSNFAALSMDINTAGTEPLRSLYTLGVGLGMRESSGKYCEGRDMSASNTSASTAEAGMFQTSYDSMSASSELSKLFDEYRAAPEKCFLDTFKTGITCSASSISGTGIGAEYQAFNKSCPAFAAEYAMVMLRVRRNHYGPINRKEAEVAPVCNQMLKSVQDFIESDLNACDEIM